MPVVAVGEHECLPVVARLKQLLDTTMQRHDEWFRLGNHWVVLVASDGQVQPHRAVDRGVLIVDLKGPDQLVVRAGVVDLHR